MTTRIEAAKKHQQEASRAQDSWTRQISQDLRDLLDLYEAAVLLRNRVRERQLREDYIDATGHMPDEYEAIGAVLSRLESPLGEAEG